MFNTRRGGALLIGKSIVGWCRHSQTEPDPPDECRQHVTSSLGMGSLSWQINLIIQGVFKKVSMMISFEI